MRLFLSPLDILFRNVLWCVLLCLPGLLSASDIEPVANIRAAVMNTLDTGIDAGIDAEISLDPALRMPRCGNPLQARRNSNTSVEVSCPQPSGWRLFVPVKIRRQQSILVLARGIAAGETIRADMLTQETRDSSRIIGAPLNDPVSAIGQVARRALAAGSVLTSAHLRPPDVIRRGDRVTLVSRQGGIEVRMDGRALGAGGIGARIHAENLSSHRRIQGVVTDAGEVQVTH